MSHEVYICYGDEDKITADAICHVLEENKFKCWIKPRDLDVKNTVNDYSNAIRQSRVMVLVFSESAKLSNYVNTEVDIAFSANVPIIVFKIDESNLDGGLEFFLKNKHWLDAYPQPAIEFRNLVIDVAKILNKPITDPIISSSIVDSVNSAIGVDNSGKSKGLKTSVLLTFACVIPIILVAISIATYDISGNLGIFLFIIAIALLIGTPIIYLLHRSISE